MNLTWTFWLAFFGLLLGHGLPGMLTGALIGLVIDSLRQARRPRAAAGGFIGPLFALLGAVAKADGRVSEAEIAVAERLMTRMGLDAAQRREAIEAFNTGKQPTFEVGRAIESLRQWVGLRRDHAFPVLDVVIETVLAEGPPSPAKMAILKSLAAALRISDMELLALLAMKGYVWGGAGAYESRGGGYVPPRRSPQGPDPYVVLGIDRDADERTIKRAYRKLISAHHPDRLGDLPEDLRRRAEARASEINAAYERIKAERGFK
ncbi:co-chaperone DjlA [Aerosticca soli]|uniref:DnaJ-like protein DjlA n=1 Tax=Aerosticca soli TaxID=2010829 RepID=A0A2Z6E7S7_9GAMM|nr:co-chaperone DjlA [Aerosticca soli]MDI3262157.1 co-chaperone DjlA [Fulvimonas sp.]BBD80832.1 DnaJ-like protein DjlA [Aerosticca soli]